MLIKYVNHNREVYFNLRFLLFYLFKISEDVFKQNRLFLLICVVLRLKSETFVRLKNAFITRRINQKCNKKTLCT